MASPPSDFRFTTEARGGYIFVWQGGLALTIEDIKPMQAAIEEALAAHNTTLVMFDNRETIAPDQTLRAEMWTWLSSCDALHRVALLQDSVRHQKRANTTAERNRVAVQAFTGVPDAEAWLLQS